jgi:tetratricopeptide (TPR) repeat protein
VSVAASPHLQSAGFLHEATLFPDLEYAFTHVLAHEVAYGTLLQPQRRDVHGRIAEALERLHADRLAEHVERLAYHALRGELWDKATTYLRQAGIKAAGRSGYAEARVYFEDALDALAHLPDTRETKVQGIDLRLDARAALAPLGQYGQILEGMRKAETLAREIGDRRRLGLVLAGHRRATEEPGEPCPRARGEPAGARHRPRAGRHEPRDRGDVPARSDALRRREPRAGRHTLPGYGARPHRRARGSPIRAAAVLRGLAPSMAGAGAAHLGRFTEATGYAEEAIGIAELAEHPHTVVESQAALGGVSLERGDLGTARRAFERGMTLLRARGGGDPNVLSGLGYAYVLSGRLSEGLPLLEESVRGEGWISSRGLGLAVRVARLAEACFLAGRAGEALEHARTAVELSRTYHERANEATALRVLADIAARTDPLDLQAARDAYAASLALAEALGMRPLVAHCHFGLGRLCGRTGQRREAKDYFTMAVTMYRELGVAHWLEQALESRRWHAAADHWVR